MNALVSYELSQDVATLTMDDGKANVMSLRMLQALNAALDRALADKAVVLLTGRTGMFSGGFDLSVFKGDPKDQYLMLEAGALITEKLLSFPLPVVAACTGHAIAMGVFLLLSTDVRVGVDQFARIQINEVQIGLTLPHFAIEVCRQRLAPAHVNLAALTAHPYTPQDAFAAGFLDELAPLDGLIDAARTQAFRLAKLHGEAFPATKLRLRQPMLQALRQAIERDLAEWNARLLNRS
jgi:enoyl-CoA hydratase